MYRLRGWQPTDEPYLKAIHEKRGYKFDIPDELAECVVVEDEAGIPRQILGTRVIREAYVWVDPDWATPHWRWHALKDGTDRLRAYLASKGITDFFVSVPPQIAKSFGRRLVKSLGFVKHQWECFTSTTR